MTTLTAAQSATIETATKYYLTRSPQQCTLKLAQETILDIVWTCSDLLPNYIQIQEFVNKATHRILDKLIVKINTTKDLNCLNTYLQANA